MSTLRTNIWAVVIIVGLVAIAFLLGGVRQAGADSAMQAIAEAEADSAAARAERERQGRRAAEEEQLRLRGRVDDLEAAHRSDRVASDDLVVRWDSARNDSATTSTLPAPALERLALADSTITALRSSLASLDRRIAATDSLLDASDSVNASLRRELEHTRAMAAALERLRPTLWQEVRKVGVLATCAAAGVGGGALVAGEERQTAGAAIGAMVGVALCAIATH